jgi:hypothetical protein
LPFQSHVFIFELLHLLPIDYPNQPDHPSLGLNRFVIIITIDFLTGPSDDLAVDHHSSLFRRASHGLFQLKYRYHKEQLVLDPGKCSLQK